MEILAAGAVLYRRYTRPEVRADAGGGVEIALIHRSRRDDWTFPKGKLEPGEHVLAAAVREVTEETGIRPVLGRPLATMRYQVEGRPKRVDYWAAKVTQPPPPFVPNDEVDALEWVPPSVAAAQLTYAHDLRLLELLIPSLADSGAASTNPGTFRDGELARGDTVPCVLLRHASAGHKSAWHGSDLLRPLDDRGLADAQTLTELLACFAPGRVISSETERCLGTVRPYAELIGATIESEPAFTVQATDDDARGEAARRRMTELLTHPSPMVICAHRENIPLLLDQARAILTAAEQPRPSPEDPDWRGVDPHDSDRDPNWSPSKGGFWILHIAGNQLASLEHHDLKS